MSVSDVNRSVLNRVLLNSQILTNKYWYLPVLDKSHPDIMPVGRGAKTSDWCGAYAGLSVCKNKEGHKGKTFKGMDCTGKVVVRVRHLWCYKPSCVVCFARGWAKREAKSIEARIMEGVKRGFGEPEHITVSFPVRDYSLSEDALREKARSALFARGVFGGCLIPHAYRIDRERNGLVYSVHFHCLGFIEDGFDVCRRCSHKRDDCASCPNFKGREVREFAKDGILVKVFNKRETVFGTAWYQSNHCSMRVSMMKKYHIVTWFGACGNRKYGAPKSETEDVCAVCGDEMTRCVHVGARRIVKNIGDKDYEAVFLDDEFDESGKPNYVEKCSSRDFG
jgi:hypothetical protein